MFRFTRKPSSGSHNQYLAKNTGLVQCRYRRRTDVVSVMATQVANRQSTEKHNMYQLLYIYIYSILPDDGPQIYPKH